MHIISNPGIGIIQKNESEHRRKEIEVCVKKATEYIEKEQFGSWGICYTYETWFNIEGLVAAGKSYNNSTSIRKACEFLLSKQLRTGGWGESHLSSINKVYTNLDGEKSNLVNTSWAMLGLMKAGQVSLEFKQ
ncbi:Cycloartenol synthase [Ananas comosus]|uniref:Cycloartenol synthase n=1 Tax=Ananas comosus TaxID=4615 RepID=A0A199UWC2_ANACO|nr:Cycloartenol synthase [Ananas comosus]